ncbi:MAG TPA: lactate racemase domain-containing protein [Pyrinomonadaceae bacterium]|nr:lactate racemase domain-containing protein [Pyrinomonadaceae bacterium]
MRDGLNKSSITGVGSPTSDLSDNELSEIVRTALADVPLDARVLAIIPDKTRDDVTHILFSAAVDALGDRQFDALVAQGTHSAMSHEEKLKKIGSPSHFTGQLFDHRWDDDSELITIGELSRDEVSEISNGLFDEPIPLSINRLLAPGTYDVVLIFGATVPHEVAGFAGGAKYFFPGVAGAELTHKTHWLAALATIEKIIGRIETPTRHLIEAAADKVQADVIAFTSVHTRDADDRLRTYALFAGDYRSSLRRAAEVSRQVHIKYTGRRYKRVVAILDEHYEDLWLGGKASYRLGNVIEEGGELIVYAPRLRCISETHGTDIERFGGYAPLEQVKDLVAASGELQSNLCVAAHLAHVSYAGRQDGDGKFVPRYRITLASQVDEETCRRVNLNYLDYRTFSREHFSSDPDTLIVERAGRDLYLVEPFAD